MSANLLVPNSYYTVYCKNIVATDTPIAGADTWCYYPSNPNGQGQVIDNAQLQSYPLLYNVSAVSKNVVVNDDGTVDIVQEGIYRLEVSANLSSSLPIVISSVVSLDATIIFASQGLRCPGPLTDTPTSFYYSIFFTIPKGNAVAKRLATSIQPVSGSPGPTLNVTGASLALQRIDAAP